MDDNHKTKIHQLTKIAYLALNKTKQQQEAIL